jgi:hypothetical protein
MVGGIFVKRRGPVPPCSYSLTIFLAKASFAALRAGHLAVQEVVDEREGLVSLVLKHEVASVEKM